MTAALLRLSAALLCVALAALSVRAAAPVRGPADSVPRYLGTLQPVVSPALDNLPSACFVDLSAKLQIVSADAVAIAFSWDGRRSSLCGATIMLGDKFSFHLVDLSVGFGARKVLDGLSSQEADDIVTNGIFLFDVPDGGIGELLDAYEFYRILKMGEDPDFVISFLKQHADWKFETRAQSAPLAFNESVLEDGDYIGRMDLDGESMMIAYGTGGHTSHAATVLWDPSHTTLYVVESCGDGIRRTPFAHWVPQHNENVSMIVAKLGPAQRAAFNSTAAWEFYDSMAGLPYGWQTFMSGWIDTPTDNYPAPMTLEAFTVALPVFDHIDPTTVRLMFLPGLNKRLNASFESVDEAYAYMDKNGILLGNVLAVPEQDDWVYASGPARVCSAFVTGLYRAAGLYGDISIQSTEFTPKDSYQVALFDTNWQRPAVCEQADPGVPWCQLTGLYRVDLLDFSSVEPYAYMNQRCGAMPPEYKRSPSNC